MKKVIVFISLAILIMGFTACDQPAASPAAPELQPSPPLGPVVVKQTGGTGVLVAECKDRRYIISTADYIIEGTVLRVESKWNEDRSSILTYTDLSIGNYVKGPLFAQDRLQIVTPGGTVGDITQVVEDQPIFHEGKMVRIYFQEIEGEFHIVCAQFGVEERQVTSGLNMRNPEQARASEIVVIKIIDNEGKPVSGVRIYSTIQLGDTVNTAQLGDTAGDGTLATFFKEPGDYQLSARTGEAGEPGFAEAKGIGMINIIPSTIEFKAFDGIVPPMPPGQTYTGEQHYKRGMTVRFSFKNTGDREIILNNSAPWKIQSREGEIIFEPIALQAVVQLAPGEDKEWAWNQKDKDDLQVNEGSYIVILKCSEGEYGLRFGLIHERLMY
jgi:hypothetical protein